MVMSEREASRRYQEGLQRIGISAYRAAAEANTVTGAAEPLEEAKNDSLNFDEFVDEYENRY